MCCNNSNQDLYKCMEFKALCRVVCVWYVVSQVHFSTQNTTFARSSIWFEWSTFSTWKINSINFQEFLYSTMVSVWQNHLSRGEKWRNALLINILKPFDCCLILHYTHIILEKHHSFTWVPSEYVNAVILRALTNS